MLKKTVSKNSTTLIIRALGISLLFGITLILTNNYDADLVGKYDFIRTFLFVSGSLCLLGTEHSVLYFSGKLNSLNKSNELKNIYFKIIKIIITSALSILFLILLLQENINTFFNDPETLSNLLSASCVLFFYALTILNTEILRTLNLIVISEIFRNIIKYLPLGLGVVLLLILNIPEFLIGVFLGGFVLISILSTCIVLVYFQKQETIKSSISVKEIFFKSYPMALSGMAFFLLQSIDIILLKKYEGNKTVAYYSVSIKFMLILSMIITAINVNSSSKIAELYLSEKKDELQDLLKQNSRFIALCTVPVTLIIVVFNKELLSLFGSQYIISSNALLVITISQGICSLFGALPVYLNMTGKQTYFQNILLISVGINFILNWFLIPKYGMLGASISFSCSLFFWNITSAIVVYKKDKIVLFIS